MTTQNKNNLINIEDILALGEADTKNKLHAETSKIGWHELQRFFASGSTLYIDPSLDIVTIATHMANDDTQTLSLLIKKALIRSVTDKEALAWYKENTVLWALVVRPWVLVQPTK